MRLPNFLVVGAAKSGTTSLFHYLEQHPDVFASPVKEPNFLAFPDDGRLNLRGPLDEAGMYRYIHRKTAKSFAAYRDLFADASRETAVGEASPRYFYIPHAAARIERYLGAPKIIVILRDPIARAYSHFLMNRRRGLEPLADFRDALDAEAAADCGRLGLGLALRRPRPLPHPAAAVPRPLRRGQCPGRALRRSQAGSGRTDAAGVRFPRGRCRLRPGYPHPAHGRSYR